MCAFLILFNFSGVCTLRAAEVQAGGLGTKITSWNLDFLHPSKDVVDPVDPWVYATLGFNAFPWSCFMAKMQP